MWVEEETGSSIHAFTLLFNAHHNSQDLYYYLYFIEQLLIKITIIAVGWSWWQAVVEVAVVTMYHASRIFF